MPKIREGMKSSKANPMDGNVHVDEFVVGGKEDGKPGRSYDSKKKKVVCAFQLTDDGKVKCFYSLKIKDFSSESRAVIFEKQISAEANITTDEWRGYGPISKNYQIKQIPSNKGRNFKALHTLIHQVKSLIRTTHSWISEKHIKRYLNKCSYRLNRSQSKATVFNNLIKRMVQADKIYHAKIICP